MANLLPFTLLAMRDFKRAYPDRTLVLGGVGPKSVEEQILERFPWVDIIVRGEAETHRARCSLGALRAAAAARARCPGISFRQDGRRAPHRAARRASPTSTPSRRPPSTRSICRATPATA